MATLADWTQGAYVQPVFSSHGFNGFDTKLLLIVGFVSPMLFGAWMGRFADKLGRRRFVLIYGIIYSAGCVFMHFRNFWAILIGRTMSGLSTALLSSVFDAWMCTEHKKRGFSHRELSSTYSLQTILNALTAVLAGISGQYVASASELRRLGRFGWSIYRGGPLAPFELAVVVLATMTISTLVLWSENYGDSAEGRNFTPIAVFERLCKNMEMRILCLIGSFYEASMFLFVTLWGPHLEAASGSSNLDYGGVFASFMVATMFGALLFELVAGLSPTYPLRVATGLAVLSHAVLINQSLTDLQTYLAFVLFEISVGMYYPAIGTLRARLLPEADRSLVVSIFGIPMNLIVTLVLLGNLDRVASYIATTLLLSGSFVGSYHLTRGKRNEGQQDLR